MTLIMQLLLSKLPELKIDGFLINTADEHSNEYIGSSDKYFTATTEFTGSNGLFLATTKGSFLWTDGRYHIQAKNELPKEITLVTEFDAFMKKLNEFGSVGIDLKYFSHKGFKKLKSAAFNVNFQHNNIAEMIQLKDKKTFNGIIDIEAIMLSDMLTQSDVRLVNEHFPWLDFKPEDLNMNVSGLSREQKIKTLQEKLTEKEVLILTSLDEIAWIFNLRGNDIEFNPIFYSYAIIDKKSVRLFTGVKDKFENIHNEDYNTFYTAVAQLSNKDIIISDACNEYLFSFLSKNNKVELSSLVQDAKSIKNRHEIFGFIMAHIYDGVALCELFDWLIKKTKTLPMKISELDVSKKLIELKSKKPGFFSASFETISATSENSAIIHHGGSTRIIEPEKLFLLDSGTQYYFGTTDVTRTLSLNIPSEKEKNDFTVVLSGQYEAMIAILAKGYNAGVLDGYARKDIWKLEDYDDFPHSLGHGVGHFLNVHESPPSISRNGLPLDENMVFSLEPGIYREGLHGIRIEDLVVSLRHTGMKLKFENITLAPLQMKMIDPEILNKEKIEHLKKFNRRILKVLSEYIKQGDLGYDFLMENTSYQ